MKNVMLICCVAFLVLMQSCFTSSSEINPGCDKGEFYNDGCNDCSCAGGVYACTRRDCEGDGKGALTNDSSRQRRELDESVTGKYDPPRTEAPKILSFDFDRCTPKEVKNEDCNRCKCVVSGRGWICQTKRCKA